MFDMKKYVSLFETEGAKKADQYRIDNAPQKLYKFIPFYDRGNPSK